MTMICKYYNIMNNYITELLYNVYSLQKICIFINQMF